MTKQWFRMLGRGEQVCADVARRRPTSWIALDDDVHGWPDWAVNHLVVSDGSQGISSVEVQTRARRLFETYFGSTRLSCKGDR